MIYRSVKCSHTSVDDVQLRQGLICTHGGRGEQNYWGSN